MDRIEIIQKIINHTNAQVYLEIGVDTGVAISQIKAARKIGVDPLFRFTNQIRLKKLLGLTKFDCFELQSDTFFENHADECLTNGIDVAFVDGLHTYAQCLKDINNCLKYLNDGGFIVVHDCNPLSFSRGYPVKESINEVFELAERGELPGWDRHWGGDVWKAIAHLRLERTDLVVFTLDTDFGVGIITKGSGVDLLNLTIPELSQADYYFFDERREELINLKHQDYLSEYLKSSK